MSRLKKENREIADVVALMDKAIFSYRLIEDGDKILIGLSGGKDSLSLLELLARRSRIRRPSFTVEAAHVAVTNIGYLQAFRQLSLPLGVLAGIFILREDRNPVKLTGIGLILVGLVMVALN